MRREGPAYSFPNDQYQARLRYSARAEDDVSRAPARGRRAVIERGRDADLYAAGAGMAEKLCFLNMPAARFR